VESDSAESADKERCAQLPVACQSLDAAQRRMLLPSSKTLPIPLSACLVARRVRVQPSKLAALLCTRMRCAAPRAGWRRPWLKKREWRLAGRRARASPMAPIDLQCWSTQRVHAWRPAVATWAQGWTCQAQRHARQGRRCGPHAEALCSRARRERKRVKRKMISEDGRGRGGCRIRGGWPIGCRA
jgi:hypothetical protein